jgi:primosomal protein N'
MYEYSVIVTQKTNLPYLSYYFDEDLEIGQVCYVDLRNRIGFGVIINKTKIESKNINPKIKSISKFFPFVISQNQINLIKNISFNTFNGYSAIWNAMSKPFENLAQKDVMILKEYYTKSLKISESNIEKYNDKINKKTSNSFSLKYELYTDITLRIMDIIRTSINTNVLFVFPEQKQLDYVLDVINHNQEFQTFLKSYNQEILIYNGKKTKSNNQTVLKIITHNTNKIIFGSRASLFLPFQSLNHIIIVDESNSMHIQEQGGFYYDSREIAYLLGFNYLTSLLFISKVPSIRLHKMNSEGFLDNSLSNMSYQNITLPKIRLISDESSKFDKNVISEAVETYLLNLLENEDQNYFYED